MTLHWWMHWFWVTAQLAVILAAPRASTTQEPEVPASDQKFSSKGPPGSAPIDIHLPAEPPAQNLRIPKAIGVHQQPSKDALQHPEKPSLQPAESTSPVGSTASLNSSDSVSRVIEVTSNDTGLNSNFQNGTNGRPSVPKKNSKITWILTSNKTTRTKFDDKSADGYRNLTSEENADLAVLPLQEEANRFKLVLNRTKAIPSSDVNSKVFANSDDAEVAELAEQQVLATAASILQAGISESTRLSRARSAFSSEFQRDQQHAQEESSGINSSSNNTASAIDIAAVTGSCLATVVVLSTMGSLGFIMYRRRYLNPPQTLNSDKCSNPDSSVYIDDSMIRDNSEEMYSLDNDSFLNSLEAMTIQNYWTDSVKHTKL